MKRIAVFGHSSMALQTMSRLNPELYSMIFIGKDELDAARVAEQGFESTVIDFRNDDALRAIGIGADVDILFCFFAKDSDNVFLTISARALDKNLIIIAIIEDPESAGKLTAAGADKIIDPYEICGRKTHQMLIKPDITTTLDETVFGRHDLHIAQIAIPKGSWLEHSKASALRLNEKHNLILIGIVDKELSEDLQFVLGEKEHTLDAGDVLVVLGPAREIRLFKEEVNNVDIIKV